MTEYQPFDISLGSTVKDKHTDFQGVVVAQCEYVYGCRRYVVQGTKLKDDGTPPDPISFDEDNVETVKFVKRDDDPPFKFEMGAKIRDTITGFEGICTWRTRWIQGQNRYGIQANKLKDGAPIDPKAFDEPLIELVEDPAEKTKYKRTGGPVGRGDPSMSK